MEKHKAINQNGSNTEISPVRKKGKSEKIQFTINKSKKVDKNKDTLKEWKGHTLSQLGEKLPNNPLLKIHKQLTLSTIINNCYVTE